MKLFPANFSEFFRAIHEYDPFPWQQRLVNELAESNQWPDVLELPTGSGKTAALDVAVFHLALQFGTPDAAALRIALVVDRRLVVDDAFARAKKLSEALSRSLNNIDANAVTQEVARRLAGLAGQTGSPLVAQRLRGGAPLEYDWARTPTQPTILCSTVDQVGSRLLFRGYGVSDRMKPIHAGLLGANSLILLDEAHLSEPFRQTVNSVRKLGKAKIKMSLLSATPGEKAQNIFGLFPEDRNHFLLKKRLNARKLATLYEISRNKNAVEEFTNKSINIADQLKRESISPMAIAIVVNRVAMARNIFDSLNRSNAIDRSVIDVILLIGRSRSVDRDAIVHQLVPFRTGNPCRADAKSIFIVATQCLEVGVDLDLDGLVTQAASLDALRQRFGRVNRAGREVEAKGAILTLAQDIAKKADDPVYGDRIRCTWEALQTIADDQNRVDFGIEALPERLKNAEINSDELANKHADAPVLMPAYLDLWSQTWPRPTVDPEVGLFLHGMKRTTAGVSIVWRSDISEDDLEQNNGIDLREIIRLMPPRAAEMIEVPLWVARAWLNQSEHLYDLSDAPECEASASDTGHHQETTKRKKAFRWSGPDAEATGIIKANQLRTGDVLIMPATYGRCDEFGWAPDCSDPVVDVADKAAKPYWGRRCAVRISRDVVGKDEQWERISGILAEEGINGEELVERLIAVLPSETEKDNTSDERPLRNIREALEALRQAQGNRISVRFPYANRHQGGAILIADQGVGNQSRSTVYIAATEDDSASQASSTRVLLDKHGSDVESFVESYAKILQLDQDIANDLQIAAYLHDAGKADPRFQAMLAGGDRWNAPDGPPLAKGDRLRSWSFQAWERAQLPRGWRHEALSVQMAQAHPRFCKAHDPGLVLWLIGCHHGFGRPFFNFLDQNPEQPLPCLEMREWQVQPGTGGPQTLTFDFNGTDWPSLFERLKQCYGTWDLAHMEAILRLADHRASEQVSVEERT